MNGIDRTPSALCRTWTRANNGRADARQCSYYKIKDGFIVIATKLGDGPLCFYDVSIRNGAAKMYLGKALNPDHVVEGLDLATVYWGPLYERSEI